jgi:hypothetical protein
MLVREIYCGKWPPRQINVLLREIPKNTSGPYIILPQRIFAELCHSNALINLAVFGVQINIIRMLI